MFKYTFFLIIFLTFTLSAQNDSVSTEGDSLTNGVDSNLVQDKSLKLKVGDKSDGSRMQSVHLLKLYDENGNTIEPNDQFPQPFSTKQTCATECHNYSIISDGFHFNYDHTDIENSRPSEPWIYTDPTTLSMIPISYRENSGTFTPAEMKLSNMKFLDRFGPYYPGGDISEIDSLQHQENFLRWNVSGSLEVNCLICHDTDPFYDKAEYAGNIRKQNYKWAASASSSLIEFKGSASKMPDNYDPYNLTTVQSIDQRSSVPPNVKYDKSKFNSSNKVFFNISKNIPNERCYYCHSSIVTDDNFTEHWKAEEDVHLKAGLNCVDCHKNGLDHNITRGIKEEKVSTFTCEGCHVQQTEDGEPNNGMLGAPIPEHAGIPPVHFERMACTTCHSGSWPNEEARFVKSSRNHFLGMHGTNKAPNVFPHVQTGIYTESEESVIEPRNVVWPSFWGRIHNEDVTPLSIEFIEDTIRPLLSLDSLFNFGDWPLISDSVLVAMLDTLQSFGSIKGEPVFVTSGKMFWLEKGKLKTSETERGNAYSWPIAHTVRPASKSLGANGCGVDCHSVISPFFNGKVTVVSSLASQSGEVLSMSDFENRSQFYQSAFSLTFFFRPWLKVLIILSALVILIVIVGYTFRGFRSISKISLTNDTHKGDE